MERNFKTGFYREICESKTKEENDKNALLMWHSIQRAIGKKEEELDQETPQYSVINGDVIVVFDTLKNNL